MQKSKTVQIIYSFKITYKHDEHLNNIIADLKNAPINEMFGASRIKNKKGFYGYSCKRIEKGELFRETLKGE